MSTPDPKTVIDDALRRFAAGDQQPGQPPARRRPAMPIPQQAGVMPANQFRAIWIALALVAALILLPALFWRPAPIPADATPPEAPAAGVAEPTPAPTAPPTPTPTLAPTPSPTPVPPPPPAPPAPVYIPAPVPAPVYAPPPPSPPPHAPEPVTPVEEESPLVTDCAATSGGGRCTVVGPLPTMRAADPAEPAPLLPPGAGEPAAKPCSHPTRCSP